jgi:hypothetical protein
MAAQPATAMAFAMGRGVPSAITLIAAEPSMPQPYCAAPSKAETAPA